MGFQSNHWVSLQNLGQPCKVHLGSLTAKPRGPEREIHQVGQLQPFLAALPQEAKVCAKVCAKLPTCICWANLTHVLLRPRAEPQGLPGGARAGQDLGEHGRCAAIAKPVLFHGQHATIAASAQQYERPAHCERIPRYRATVRCGLHGTRSSRPRVQPRRRAGAAVPRPRRRSGDGGPRGAGPRAALAEHEHRPGPRGGAALWPKQTVPHVTIAPDTVRLRNMGLPPARCSGSCV